MQLTVKCSTMTISGLLLGAIHYIFAAIAIVYHCRVVAQQELCILHGINTDFRALMPCSVCVLLQTQKQLDWQMLRHSVASIRNQLYFQRQDLNKMPSRAITSYNTMSMLVSIRGN